jgi:hypothetical protein
MNMTGHRRPAAPALVLWANGAVLIQPAPLHFTVTTARRRNGSLRITVRRSVEL